MPEERAHLFLQTMRNVEPERRRNRKHRLGERQSTAQRALSRHR
jgi:hypothetical protein